MDNRFVLFDKVLHVLAKEGVLDKLILIGGWCPYLYRIHYDNTPYISSLRTMDIDFLIPRPFKDMAEINVDILLTGIGFGREYSIFSGNIRYVHPELEVEFLTPEIGRGSSEPMQFTSLHLTAQKMRFLRILQQYCININYEGLLVRVPEPAAYVLHKFILSEKRENLKKREKDLSAAIEIGEFLLYSESGKNRLSSIYRELPVKWKAIISRVMKPASPKLYSEIVLSGT